MRIRRAALLAMVAGIATVIGLLTPVDARAGQGWSTTRTMHYLAGDVGPMRDMPGQVLTFPSCSLRGGTPAAGHGVGSLCFGRTVGDTFTVRIQDDSGREVGGIVIISAHNGEQVSHTVCGTSKPLRVVPGSLSVYLDAPGDVRGTHWFGGPGCTEIRPLGATTGATTQGATSGRVDVTFTRHG